MVRNEPERLVSYLGFCLYQARLAPHEAAPFLKFLQGRDIDDTSLKELLHLMMSTPQFQLT
jgi:hypothetical protein